MNSTQWIKRRIRLKNSIFFGLENKKLGTDEKEMKKCGFKCIELIGSKDMVEHVEGGYY